MQPSGSGLTGGISAPGCTAADLPPSAELGCLGWASPPAPGHLLCGVLAGSAYNTQPSVVAPFIPLSYTLDVGLREIS